MGFFSELKQSVRIVAYINLFTAPFLMPYNIDPKIVITYSIANLSILALTQKY